MFDPRENAMLALLATAVLNTAITWNYLPYFPIELSQMGWDKPGAAGGYHVLQIGLSVAGGIMFRYHVEERSLLGVVGATLMVLLGLINGNDVPILQTAHGAVALSCFVVYLAYIQLSSGWSFWLKVAFATLCLSHTIVFREVDFHAVLLEREWALYWTQAQAKHPLWLQRLKATTQYTMIVAFCIDIFRVPLVNRTNDGFYL